LLPTILFSTVKQLSLSWLCHFEVHHSNLHVGTNCIQLIRSLKLNRSFHSLFRYWYWLLTYIKSVRERVIFGITNGSVRHVYKFPDFTWRKSEKSYGSTELKSGLFYDDSPHLCSQGQKRRSLTLTWILQLILQLEGIHWHNCEYKHYYRSVASFVWSKKWFTIT
jgi:hypothetical protein